MSEIKFSIIIPAYNCGRVILDALNSTINQDFSGAYEVIVVNDCSTDDSLQIIHEFEKNAPIRVISTEINSGPGIARNIAIEEARGDWVCFLDSDDILSVDFLSVLFNAIDVNDEVDLLAYNISYVEADSKPRLREDLHRLQGDKSEIISQYLQNRIDSHVIGYCFKRNLLQENQLRFRSGFHEDVAFLFSAIICAVKIGITSKPIYTKNSNPTSIINTIGVKHIDGFFLCLEDLYGVLKSKNIFNKHKDSYLVGLRNIVSSRISRIFSGRIAKLDDSEVIVSTIHSRLKLISGRLKLGPDELNALSGVGITGIKTRYEKIFQFLLSLDRIDGQSMKHLGLLVTSSWSCYDLNSSVFLAPGEVRTCCKRYYFKGKLMGDVPLLKCDGDVVQKFLVNDVKQEKLNLFTSINKGESTACDGCPFLEFKQWKEPLDEGIKYLSIEYQTYCNMRCTYCSDTYYGGEKPKYDVEKLIKSMVDDRGLKDCEYIVWGGGEPVLDKKFEKLISLIDGENLPVKQRVITNATKYSSTLGGLLKKDSAFIVTSIDAGTNEVFKSIRKYNNFGKVLSNLRRYYADKRENIIIKYIITSENLHTQELESFVEVMKQEDLLGANFQISCNFYNESIDASEVVAITTLNAMLLKAGAEFVFCDDLVWQRIFMLDEGLLEKINSNLANLGLMGFVLNPLENDSIAIWGTGAQSSLLHRKANFFKGAKIAYYVDPRVSHIGLTLNGIKIYSPEMLLQDAQRKICIAAVQSAPLIYEQIKKMGISKDRVLRGLLL